MNEIWKGVPGYVDTHEVSNLGEIRSINRQIIYNDGRIYNIKGKVLSKRICPSGYYMVDLKVNGKRKTFRVHQLIALTFLNHSINGYNLVVDHIDSNKLNNNINNLQSVSQRLNTSKSNVKKTSIYTGVHKCKKSNKWVSTIRINGDKVYLGSYVDEVDAHYAYQSKLQTL